MSWLRISLPLLLILSVFVALAILNDSIWPLAFLAAPIALVVSVFLVKHFNDEIDKRSSRWKELRTRLYRLTDEFGPMVIGAVVLFVMLGGILRSCNGECSSAAARFDQCD